MPRIDGGLIGQLGQRLEAFVHLLGVRTRKIGASTTVEEQRVSRNQTAAREKALAARRVTRRVDECDVDGADRQCVTGTVRHEVGCIDLGRTDHPRHLGFVHVDGHVVRLEQMRDAVDVASHHRTTDVVGVVVRGEDAGQGHAIRIDDAQELVNRISRIDDDALPCRAIAEQIDVVDHLCGETVAHRKVTAGQQLPEIEPVINVHGHRLWRTLSILMNAAAPDPKSGDRILVGDRLVSLTSEMISTLSMGGKLIPLRSSQTVLSIPVDVRHTVESAVSDAVDGFRRLQATGIEHVDEFFERFAALIEDDGAFAAVLEANYNDVLSARERGRATGRLEITSKMRSDMAAGLRMWAGLDFDRLGVVASVEHDGWSVESWRAPLGVVAFVFEGRPNVFADATGVLKSGNSVVFRIGSDALGTARAIRDHLLWPALDAAGLPRGAVSLVDSAEHAAGWALFDDPRLALAVARGSGFAVGQLGEVARQCGTPVSLHGTGGAWLVVGSQIPHERLTSAIVNSLDRKVCNTLNTIVALESNQTDALHRIADALESVAAHRKGSVVVHATQVVADVLGGREGLIVVIGEVDPGVEWEWDDSPEVTVIVSTSLADAVTRFNQHSPRFVMSVLSDDEDEVTWAWENSESPFFGDGFTRWVDGQFALERPELGLANWQNGRLLGRSGVLSGDGVHSVRLRVRQMNPNLRR